MHCGLFEADGAALDPAHIQDIIHEAGDLSSVICAAVGKIILQISDADRVVGMDPFLLRCREGAAEECIVAGADGFRLFCGGGTRAFLSFSAVSPASI